MERIFPLAKVKNEKNEKNKKDQKFPSPCHGVELPSSEGEKIKIKKEQKCPSPYNGADLPSGKGEGFTPYNDLMRLACNISTWKIVRFLQHFKLENSSRLSWRSIKKKSADYFSKEIQGNAFSCLDVLQDDSRIRV